MSSVTATINVNINAANAAAQLAALQGKVASMNKGMLAATAGGVMAQEKAIKRMGNVLSGSGMFTTGIRNVHTQLGRMHQEFDRGSTTLSKYRQNSKMWSNDHSRINALAADRVKMLQSQYVALGKEMNGVQKAMQIKPDRMMREFGADAMYATQQQMLFRRNLQMGATSLVNWGKNTQWAGRQMMVGMGIPIAIVSAGAIKSFNEIEKASIAFKRVYGDTATSVGEKSQMLSNVQKGVAKDMMQYGISMADTLDVAAKAAATGAQGADLIAATRETMRLATLGNMDYQKALESTIAMQTAFGISSEDMGQKTDFLNAVENQTILSMEDMALAVPRVAPVIKGLGGGIEELAIMMTALRQGGVTAEQGANALKSGLASMINPTSTATEALGNMGINLDKIVKANKGDIIGTVQGLGKALEGLSKFKRQQALESLFGKYQYARMGALLKNINSKAVKETMKMAKAAPEELAKMSAQELSQISDSPMIKLRASIERLKAAAAPLGAVLSDIGAKVIGFVTPMVEFFSNNSWARGFLIGVAGIAAVAGTLTMIVGVLANFAGSMVKAGMAVKNFFRIITGRGSLAYVASEELEATAAANSLASASERAASAHMAQANAAKLLVSELNALAAAQLKATGATSAVGTRPVTTAPAPKTTKPLVSAYPQDAAFFNSGYDRTHAGRPIVMTSTDPRYQAWKNNWEGYYTDERYPGGIPNNERTRILRDMQAGMPITGYNAEAFLMKSDLNRLMDTSKAGAPTRQIVADAQALGARTVAPYFDNLARAMGITSKEAQQAFHSDPKIREIAGRMSSGYISALSSVTEENMTGERYQQVTAPVLDQAKRELRALSPEIATAVDKVAQPGFVSSPSQKDRVPMPTRVNDTVAWGKSGDIGRVVGTTNFADIPLFVADKDGNIKGTVVPDSSPAGKATKATTAAANKISASSAFIPAGTKGVTYGPSQLQQVAKTQPKTPVPAPTQTKIAQPRQFTGMGLMGAGMLASTAMMGLQSAGKEIPNAVEFAVQGLTGVGMAAMFFPGTMQKVGTGLSKVAGLMGPWGLAIGAAVAVIGGTALAWRKINIDARRRGDEYGRALADATYYANEVASAYGNTSYVTQQQLKEAGTTQEELTTSQQFLASPAGKSWLKENSALMMKIGPEMASSSMAMQVASWVVQGVMKTENIAGMITAINQQSPGMGTGLGTQLQSLMGKNYKTKDMAALSDSILNSQIFNATRAASLFRQKEQDTKGANVGDWIQGIFGGPLAAAVSWFKGGGEEGAKKNMLPMGAPIGKNIQDRVASEEMQAATAGVWNAQLKTAFANRLAVEARLSEMVDARDVLARKKEKGTATAEDIKNLKALQTQIDTTKASSEKFNANIAAAFEQNKQMNALGNQTWYAAQLDSLRNMGKKDQSGLTTYMAEAVNDQKMLWEKTDGAQGMDRGAANNVLSALKTGVISPAAASNLTNFGNELARLPAIINALPAPKLQDFATQIGNMTGPQAQSALQNFGQRFTNAARAANLSAREAGKAARELGANKQQVKQVKINVKADKIKDPTAGLKNKNISVNALTGPAETRLKRLKKLAEEATGKDIKIKANSNADAVTKKLRKMIETGEAANGKGVYVETDTNAPETEGEVQSLGDTINTIAGAGIAVPVTATDEASPVAKTAADALNNVGSLTPNPSITAVSNAAAVALAAQASMNSVRDVTRYIDIYTRKHGATGGLFNYANGGVHKGAGKVTGPGGPTDDKVNARLSNGEFVIKASSVNKYGTAFLNAVNQGALPGYKDGTPLSAKKMSGDQSKEYKKILDESRGIIKEFSKFSAILKHARAALGLGMKGMDQEFTQYIIDNYNPKQIKKMFAGKKDVGAKVIAKRFAHEQYGQEVRSQQRIVRNARYRDSLLRQNNALGEEGPKATAIANMSDEQLEMYRGLQGKGKAKKKARRGFMKRLVDVELINKQQEDFKEEKDKYKEAKDRKKSVLKSYQSATGATAFGIMPKVGATSIKQLEEYADALGTSIDELAQQIEDGDLPSNFEDLAKKAVEAKKAMEVLAMTAVERQSERLSNNQSRMSNLQDLAGANARKAISAKYGKSQSELEAGNALRDAQNAIDQATIDDINEKYDKQLNTIDQINQHQQAIANLERGRLSVAGALSSGDIAAAAAAAQEHRNNMASFAQDQMRNQLENQQKATTSALQDQINARMRVSRDIQNQIALLTAQANLDQAAAIGAIQAENDEIMTTEGYIAAANEELRVRNDLLDDGLATLQAQVALAAQLNIGVPEATAPTAPAPINIGGSAYKAKAAKPPKKKKKAFGGLIPGIGNTDSVHTMLTPGEFVIRKAQAAKFGPTLRDINAGSFKGGAVNGGNVNIDNIIFQINGANLNERDIADIAVRKMQTLDAATIRGGRF